MSFVAELDPQPLWRHFDAILEIPRGSKNEGKIRDYIREHEVPYNPLHDAGYPSIGCACCTRAVEPGEDVRAGRWWWETPEKKECGLHWNGGTLVCSRAPQQKDEDG